jgi:hypothetical protein
MPLQTTYNAIESTVFNNLANKLLTHNQPAVSLSKTDSVSTPSSNNPLIKSQPGTETDKTKWYLRDIQLTDLGLFNRVKFNGNCIYNQLQR